MIVFRHADPRLPFLWESPAQPAARWHDAGDGPAQYFADTPDGAWAELLRHEEIDDAADLATIRRTIWAIDIEDDEEAATPDLPQRIVSGGPETYARCRAAARALRNQGVTRLEVPSAALAAGGARGLRTDAGLRPAAPRDARTIVLFGMRPALVGWRAVYQGWPSHDLLGRVRYPRRAR